MIIAVDGPAASGKGTLARRLAAHYGLNYLDTGLLYRAVGHSLVSRGIDPGDAEQAIQAARDLDTSILDDPALRNAGAGEAASRVAAIPEVREALKAFQRAFAGRAPGAVLDGRDIGTVICPDAPVKLFVTASLDERARRRTLELQGRGDDVNFDDIRGDLKNRDERDMQRSASPMKQAEDAHLLDTSNLDIEAAFRAAVEVIDAASSG